MEDGTVLEFCDPRIQEIQKSVEELLGVEVAYHSLTFYGKCKSQKESSN
jgi:Fur family ferric uptake transcriptional regulator